MDCYTKEEINECSHKELLKAYCIAISTSWKWVTADEILEKGPGIISCVILTAKANACAVTLHDGVDTNGETIATLETSASQSRPYAFHDHLYFKRGLYVDVDANTLGILVVWHPLPFGALKG